jgi:hypothetical protein
LAAVSNRAHRQSTHHGNDAPSLHPCLSSTYRCRHHISLRSRGTPCRLHSFVRHSHGIHKQQKRYYGNYAANNHHYQDA